jgi:hypothetical protein
MNKFAFSTAVTGMIVAAAVGWCSAAQAAPTGDASAGDTIRSLQGQGYNVQINGSVTAPLTQCLVTGVHGLVHDRLRRRRLPTVEQLSQPPGRTSCLP